MLLELRGCYTMLTMRVTTIKQQKSLTVLDHWLTWLLVSHPMSEV